MKIVILDGYTLNPGDISWQDINALGEVINYDFTEEKDIVSRIGDAQIIFTNKTPITEETINKTNLKYIGVLATGYNVVDVNAAAKKGIVVTNIPTYGTTAVAQFVFALLLEGCHHIQDHSYSVKKGDWTASRDFCYWNYPLIELAGKTMGIVGFGRIGQAVAKIAVALGMKVIFDDVMVGDDFDFACKVSRDELYQKSDVISLHCPLFDSTKGMINEQSINKMRDGVILINTSRGPLVDEKALSVALKSKKIAFAGVDVVSTEPIKADNPLLECDNILITPHIAWATKEARVRLMDIACDNLKAFLAGKPQNNVAK